MREVELRERLDELVQELPPVEPDAAVVRTIHRRVFRRRAAIVCSAGAAVAALAVLVAVLSGPADRNGMISVSGSTPSSSLASTSRPILPRALEAQAIRAAFLGWTNTKPRDEVGDYVEDFDGIRDSIVAAAAKAPLPVDDYTGRVDDVSMIDATHALVTYDFLNGGTVVVAGRTGVAVKIDGRWMVSRDTVCAALAVGGTRCPPRADR